MRAPTIETNQLLAQMVEVATGVAASEMRHDLEEPAEQSRDHGRPPRSDGGSRGSARSRLPRWIAGIMERTLGTIGLG